MSQNCTGLEGVIKIMNILQNNSSISWKELTNWFQTTEANFKKHKKDKLEVLKNYCSFEILEDKTGIFIKEVYKEVYEDSRFKYKIGNLIGPS